jgi:hypothetical protein
VATINTPSVFDVIYLAGVSLPTVAITAMADNLSGGTTITAAIGDLRSDSSIIINGGGPFYPSVYIPQSFVASPESFDILEAFVALAALPTYSDVTAIVNTIAAAVAYLESLECLSGLPQEVLDEIALYYAASLIAEADVSSDGKISQERVDGQGSVTRAISSDSTHDKLLWNQANTLSGNCLAAAATSSTQKTMIYISSNRDGSQ